MSEFEIYGHTIPNHGKEKNGDSFLIKDLQAEKILLAVVSDGVSNQPCDWLASKVTCEKIVEYFMANNRLAISDRTKESVLKANIDITNTQEKCAGMCATASVLAWSYSENNYSIANIGDSRIYSIKDSDYKCLTKDDAIKRKEKVFTSAGSRLIETTQLTQVMGKSSLDIQIIDGKIENNEILVLATDGFYEARPGSFNKLLIKFGNEANFKTAFLDLINNFEMLRGDDLTVVALKKLKSK